MRYNPSAAAAAAGEPARWAGSAGSSSSVDRICSASVKQQSKASTRWYVDGRPHPAARWALAPGHHWIRAVDAWGDSAEVSVAVE